MGELLALLWLVEGIDGDELELLLCELWDDELGEGGLLDAELELEAEGIDGMLLLDELWLVD